MTKKQQKQVHIQTAITTGAQDVGKILKKLPSGGRVAFQAHPFSFRELMEAGQGRKNGSR